MITAAIFDMDGVIADTEHIQALVWKEFFATQGISVTEDDLSRMKGRRAVDVLAMFMPNNPSAEQIAQLRQQRFEVYKTHWADIRPVAGVESFMAALKKRGIRIAVATSAVKETSYLLEHLNVRQYIEVLVTGDEVSKGKPDPEIYLTTADRLKVSPNNCLVFEDAHVGAEAATRAGMPVVAILTSYDSASFPDVVASAPDFTKLDLDKLLSI